MALAQGGESPAAPPRVLCLGEALVDRLGPPGEDPARLPADQLDDRLGGAPANVACGLARLGTPVAFLGRLGRDAIGAAFAALFAQRGVEVSALQWDDQRPSRVVLVQRDRQGERRFRGFAGDRGAGFADQALEAQALAAPLERLLGPADWLLVGTIPLASPASAAALQLALERARARGVAIAVDVNWRPTFWDPSASPQAGPPPAARAAISPLLEQASLLKLAAEEAEWLFGTDDPSVVAAALPRHPSVVITNGAAEVAWCMGESVGAMPTFTLEVVDTTGAGDGFLAGLLHSLCQGQTRCRGDRVETLIRFACACGALVCLGAGAIDPQPTEHAVQDFLAGPDLD